MLVAVLDSLTTIHVTLDGDWVMFRDPESDIVFHHFYLPSLFAIQVMVFARSYGPHNHQAKDLLRRISKNINVHVEFLDVDLLPGWDSSLIMMELQDLTGQWSFPNIFIGKKHVGGNQELDQKHALGELEDMIKNVGQEL